MVFIRNAETINCWSSVLLYYSVDSANETSIDMKIRSNSSMTNNPVISSTIEFTSAAASSPTGADRPSVVMDATDMISSDMRLNDTHLVYGTRGESLKLSGNTRYYMTMPSTLYSTMQSLSLAQ